MVKSWVNKDGRRLSQLKILKSQLIEGSVKEVGFLQQCRVQMWDKYFIVSKPLGLFTLIFPDRETGVISRRDFSVASRFKGISWSSWKTKITFTN